MLPRHVHAVTWKSGRKAYYWHRFRGTPRAEKPVRLPGDPASAEFWDAIRALEAGPKPQGGIARMIAAYQASPHYQGLAMATRREYGRYLSTLDQALGQFETAELLPAHVAGFRDDLGQTPAKANAYVKAIAALYAWGRERGFAVTNPADGISKLKLGQYRPWPQWAWRISQKHFRPELRLACGLALYTGQRLGDVLAMKLGDIRKGAITVRQAKTGKTLQIPLHRDALPLIEQLKRAAAP